MFCSRYVGDLVTMQQSNKAVKTITLGEQGFNNTHIVQFWATIKTQQFCGIPKPERNENAEGKTGCNLFTEC